MRKAGRCVTIWAMATKDKDKADARVAFEVDGVRIEEATPEEWQAMLEEIAQHDLGMSLAEFERAYWAGELDPCEGRVAGLAVLMPERER